MPELKKIEYHFNQAEALDETERQAYLKNLALNEPELAEKVGHLIQLAHQDDTFFNEPLLPDHLNPLRQLPKRALPRTDDTPEFIGPYRILESIGSGGMGQVFKASRNDLYHEVALKVLKPERDHDFFLDIFRVERQALALLKHENISGFYDSGVSFDHRLFLAMEFVDGIPIDGYCELNRLSLSARLQLFLQVSNAVMYAHSKGIIHGDLKPSNILVIERPHGPMVKVIDFGLAHIFTKNLASLVQNPNTSIIGSPAYMSPERTLANRPMDTLADIYALGAILFELLVGQPPLRIPQEASKADILDHIANGPRQSLQNALSDDFLQPWASRRNRTDILKELHWIVTKALELRTTDRFATVKELADEIHRYLNHLPLCSAPKACRYVLAKWIYRNRCIFVIGLLLTCIFLLLLLALRLTQTNPAHGQLHFRELPSSQCANVILRAKSKLAIS